MSAERVLSLRPWRHLEASVAFLHVLILSAVQEGSASKVMSKFQWRDMSGKHTHTHTLFLTEATIRHQLPDIDVSTATLGEVFQSQFSSTLHLNDHTREGQTIREARTLRLWRFWKRLDEQGEQSFERLTDMCARASRG